MRLPAIKLTDSKILHRTSVKPGPAQSSIQTLLISSLLRTALNQLDLMGIFDQVAGILLGTFTKYEKAGLSLSVYDLLKMHIPDSLPVAQTAEIGHGADSKAIIIGRNLELKK